jgi:hypothetical protein
MKIQAKPSDLDMSLYEVARHPVFFGEFMREINSGLDYDNPTEEDDWKYERYQEEMLCDANPYVGICTARSVGKTTVLEDLTARQAVNMFFDGMMFTVPNQVHIDPPFLRLMALFRTHPFLKHFAHPRKSFNSQKYNIVFNNGFIFDGRIAGTSGGEQNVAGAHYAYIIVDEGGMYPWGTWVALQPCLNSWEKGAQLVVAGVPTGMRESNVLWHTDQESEQYTKHNVTAHQNPRYTREDELRNVIQFGGETSEDYKHMVKGEHGSPVYSMFDRAQMLLEDYRYPTISLTREEHKDNIQHMYLDLTSLPRFPDYAQKRYIGMDCGYTDPTVIIPWYYSSGRWRALFRLTLYQCKYPVQREVLSILNKQLNPMVIGIDEGHGGRAFIQEISEHNPEVYELIIPVNFAAGIPVGYDDDGKEINVRAKQFGMQKLQQMTNGFDIAYSKYDEVLISELERTTYTKSPLGNVTYKTLTPRGGERGADHNVAALLSFVVALYLKDEFANVSSRKPSIRELFKPGWLV